MGLVLASLLLQGFQSAHIDALKYASVNNITISATENAQKSKDSWTNFAAEWLPRCSPSYDSTGVIYIDGHTMQLTRSFINIVVMHSEYIVVGRIHTSMIFLVADIGINRVLKTIYVNEYTMAFARQDPLSAFLTMVDALVAFCTPSRSFASSTSSLPNMSSVLSFSADTQT